MPPRVSIPESDGKGSQGHDGWGQVLPGMRTYTRGAKKVPEEWSGQM
jgi:hypothetical protein